MMKRKGLFITGTDTGIGKTIVTGGLARLLRRQGITPGVMKPVETGCLAAKGGPIARDGRFLKFMAGAEEPLEQIVPYRLLAPLAPYAAAAKENVRIQPAKIKRHYKQISGHHPFTLVEGAGGLLVPITRKYFMADLIQTLNLPVLLVCRLGLGTLNHSLLSLDYLKKHHIPVAGIVLNNAENHRGPANASNPEILKELGSVPVLGTIPYQPDIRPIRSQCRRISDTIARHIDFKKIL